MLDLIETSTTLAPRRIIHRTAGRRHGPITRLVSPGDLGAVIKPFVFLDAFDVDPFPAGGFGYHPHSGIATVSTVFEGDTQYEDSTGKAGVLKAGGVEWMKAGGGVWHTAAPSTSGRVRGYQLWIALPETVENSPAESHYLDPAEVVQSGPVRVILGRYGDVSSLLPSVSPLTYLHVQLADREGWTFTPPAGHDIAWVAVDQGVLEVPGADLSHELAVFEGGAAPLTFRARGAVNFMLGSAAQHPHPLVTGYYSVHTSAEALQIGEAGIQEIGRRMKAEGRL